MSAVMGALYESKDISFDAKTEKEEILGGETIGISENTDSDKLGSNLSRDSDCTIGNIEEDMGEDDNDDETDKEESDEDNDGVIEEGKKKVIELGPRFTLKEQIEKDKDDDSLRRWKEKLLGGIDLSSVGENPEPEVKILSLSILSPDRPDLVIPLPFIPNSKGCAFSLKDGSQYRLRFSFTVSNNIVSGLKYINTVWKTGVRVEKTRVMLGTFSPRQDPYTFEMEEETTPSGIFARGSYSAKTKFVDDDGKCHLDMNYSFEIRKDWVSSS